eukprot:scaffold550357_cov18-Prasinocladus_malaysianus.AAC.1
MLSSSSFTIWFEVMSFQVLRSVNIGWIAGTLSSLTPSIAVSLHSILSKTISEAVEVSSEHMLNRLRPIIAKRFYGFTAPVHIKARTSLFIWPVEVQL